MIEMIECETATAPMALRAAYSHEHKAWQILGSTAAPGLEAVACDIVFGTVHECNETIDMLCTIEPQSYVRYGRE